MADRLPTYLRTYRKRFGLNQKELSFLLGCQSGVSVCQYERSVAQPSFEAAIASEVVLDASVDELFPSIYKKVSEGVVERARRMLKQLPEGTTDAKTKLKRQQLEKIISRYADEVQNNVWKVEKTTSPAF